MSRQWGEPGRQPAMLESGHPALTVGLVILMAVLLFGLGAGLGVAG